MSITSEQREYLRQEIDRRRRMVACHGCGKEIERTSERRRYCGRACANRHWHVRNPGRRNRAASEGAEPHRQEKDLSDA
jgi:hypothetical protein